MPLLTYADARPYARAIREKVVSRQMPPWPADPRFGRFRNESSLTEDQVKVLAAWAEADAPQGAGTPPAPPRMVEGWSNRMRRPPDLVIEAPTTFDLPATGQIPIVTVWTKPPTGHDEFVEAVELRPTNSGTIHHAAVFRAKMPQGFRIGKGELWPGGPVADGVAVTRDGGAAAGAAAPIEALAKPLIFYVPSGGFLRLAGNVAKRLESDDYLLWMFHLTTSGQPQQGGARLGLWFSHGDPAWEVVTWTVTDKVFVDGREVPRNQGGPLIPDIPAGAPEFTVTGAMAVKEPITLYALWPHMHVRGRDMTFSVVDPKGHETTLLSVPRYQFDWQFTYELAAPVKIAAGSTIRAVAHYDNSAGNKANPDPTRPVTWGPQATNEMFDPFVEISYDRRRLGQFAFPDFPHP